MLNFFTEIEEPPVKRRRIEQNVLPESLPQPKVITVCNYTYNMDYVQQRQKEFYKKYFPDKSETSRIVEPVFFFKL